VTSIATVFPLVYAPVIGAALVRKRLLPGLSCLDPGICPLEAALRSELLLIEVVGENRAEAVEVTGAVALDALASHVFCASGHSAPVVMGSGRSESAG
jgi:hypothetical protein